MEKFLGFVVEAFMRLGLPALCLGGVKYFIPGEPLYENILAFVAAIIGLVVGNEFCGGVRGNE